MPQGFPARVCLFTEASSAGVGRHVLDLAEGLAARSAEVHLLYSPLRASQQFRDRLASALRRGLYQSAELPLAHWPAPSDFLAAASLRAYLKRQGPFDVLHLHSTKAGFLGRIAATSSTRALVYTPHASLTLDQSRPAPVRHVSRLLETTLSRACDAIIAVSSGEAHHLRGIVHSRTPVRMVFNGIDPQQFADSCTPRNEARANWSLAPDRPFVIGFIGRLVSQKNPALLLQALHRARSESSLDMRAVVVGDGPLLASLQERSSALGLTDSVLWLGQSPAETCIRGFDVLVLPSDYEAMPYVLLEAMAAGVPVVATDVGGAPELVQNPRCGIVVPRSNPGALAAAITHLATHASQRHSLAERTGLAIAPFTIDGMVDRTIEVYQSTLTPDSSKELRT